MNGFMYLHIIIFGERVAYSKHKSCVMPEKDYFVCPLCCPTASENKSAYRRFELYRGGEKRLSLWVY